MEASSVSDPLHFIPGIADPTKNQTNSNYFFLNVFLSLLFMFTKQKSVLITIFLATRIRIHISWSGSGSETQDAGLFWFLSKTGGALALLFCRDMWLILTLLRQLQLDLHHPQNQPWIVPIKLTTPPGSSGRTLCGSWLFWSSYCTGQRIIDQNT